MTREDVAKMIEKCKDEATLNYRNGNIKEGKKWEKETKYFQNLLEEYEEE